ncbi:hypothetical protein H5410_021013 [Solanum commersonii]|uniref:Uncharacterized protein n=1 Tax=Solanum commersonii TaxID=4109 RepID=A0A9J5ZDZ0_SOLCO|nr:hypothetical protein H5410_021013 [Solanum commersonii]
MDYTTMKSYTSMTLQHNPASQGQDPPMSRQIDDHQRLIIEPDGFGSVGARIVARDMTLEPDPSKDPAKNDKVITPETGSHSNGTETRRKIQLNTPHSEVTEEVVENLQQINGTVAKEVVKDTGKDEKTNEPWVNMFKKNRNVGNGYPGNPDGLFYKLQTTDFEEMGEGIVIQQMEVECIAQGQNRNEEEQNQTQLRGKSREFTLKDFPILYSVPIKNRFIAVSAGGGST